VCKKAKIVLSEKSDGDTLCIICAGKEITELDTHIVLEI